MYMLSTAIHVSVDRHTMMIIANGFEKLTAESNSIRQNSGYLKDVKMSPDMTTHHTPHRFCAIRRNRLLCIALVCVVSLTVFVWNSAFFLGVKYSSGGLCKLVDIDVETKLDADRFKGKWFGMYTKGMESPVLSYFLEFNDIRIDFFPKEGGIFDIKSIGAKFLGMWCPAGEGEAIPKDDHSRAQLNIHFDTPTGKKLGTKPAWVLKTDYESYAVIYSCWEETDDGYCKPESAYALLMQRKKIKLPADKRNDIDKALESACINPKAVKSVTHKGHCIKDNQDIVV